MLRPEVVSDLVCEGDVGGGEQRVVTKGDVAWGNQISAANRLISEVVQFRRRPLLGPSPG